MNRKGRNNSGIHCMNTNIAKGTFEIIQFVSCIFQLIYKWIFFSTFWVQFFLNSNLSLQPPSNRLTYTMNGKTNCNKNMHIRSRLFEIKSFGIKKISQISWISSISKNHSRIYICLLQICNWILIKYLFRDQRNRSNQTHFNWLLEGFLTDFSSLLLLFCDRRLSTLIYSCGA